MLCEPIHPDNLQGGPEVFPIDNLSRITRTADILIVAVGYPELVRSHWVKPGAVVLDVGINVVGNEIPMKEGNQEGAFQVVGDVAFKEVSGIASAITPVPGGVGPMTISAVMHNTILAASKFGMAMN